MPPGVYHMLVHTHICVWPHIAKPGIHDWHVVCVCRSTVSSRCSETRPRHPLTRSSPRVRPRSCPNRRPKRSRWRNPKRSGPPVNSECRQWKSQVVSPSVCPQRHHRLRHRPLNHRSQHRQPQCQCRLQVLRPHCQRVLRPPRQSSPCPTCLRSHRCMQPTRQPSPCRCLCVYKAPIHAYRCTPTHSCVSYFPHIPRNIQRLRRS